MPKKTPTPAETLFRNAPESAKALLKSSHAAARLKSRQEWRDEQKWRGEPLRDDSARLGGNNG